MPEHVWSVLCYKASIDQRDNLVSLLDIPEKLAATLQPGTEESIEQQLEQARGQSKEVLIPVHLQLLSWWVRSDPEQPEEGTARLRLLLPVRGRRIPAKEFPIHLTDHRSLRHRVLFEVLPFRGFGFYWFLIDFKSGKGWRRVAKIPLEIVPSAEPEKSG